MSPVDEIKSYGPWHVDKEKIFDDSNQLHKLAEEVLNNNCSDKKAMILEGEDSRYTSFNAMLASDIDGNYEDFAHCALDAIFYELGAKRWREFIKKFGLNNDPKKIAKIYEQWKEETDDVNVLAKKLLELKPV